MSVPVPPRADVLGNLLKTIGGGAKVYEDGKRMLEVTIGEYDQAVVDLTAAVVQGTAFQAFLIST